MLFWSGSLLPCSVYPFLYDYSSWLGRPPTLYKNRICLFYLFVCVCVWSRKWSDPTFFFFLVDFHNFIKDKCPITLYYGWGRLSNFTRGWSNILCMGGMAPGPPPPRGDPISYNKWKGDQKVWNGWSETFWPEFESIMPMSNILNGIAHDTNLASSEVIIPPGILCTSLTHITLRVGRTLTFSCDGVTHLTREGTCWAFWKKKKYNCARETHWHITMKLACDKIPQQHIRDKCSSLSSEICRGLKNEIRCTHASTN